MAERGMSKLFVKETNQMQILMQLLRHGPMSRVDLSRGLYLTKAGVSVLVSEMLEDGLLREVGELNEQGKPGKKKIGLDINAAYGQTIGCVIDTNFVYAGLADVCGKVIFERAPYPIHCESMQALCADVLEALNEVSERADPSQTLAIGVGINEDVREMLPEVGKLGVRLRPHFPWPIVVQSSTMALATAQVDFRTKSAIDNFLFVEVSDAVNIAFFLNGEPYHGAHGNAGSMSHVVVDPNGPVCSCGRRGCVNALVSVKYVLQKVQQTFSKENFPLLYELVGGNPKQLNYDALVLAAEKGDPKAKEIYDQAERLFQQLLLNLVSMFDPARCFIQGMGIYASDYIEQCNAFAERYLDERYQGVFELSAFNRKQVFLGGCAIAGRRYFYQKAIYAHESSPSIEEIYR